MPSWPDTGKALRTVGGIVTGLLIRGALTLAELAAALAASPAAYLTVKPTGAGCLVFLGAQALWQYRRAAPVVVAKADPAGSPWRTGLVGNVLNPKIAVFSTGLLPTPAPPGLPTTWTMALLVLAWLGSYVLLLSKAAPVLQTPRIRRAPGRTTGIALIGIGLVVATASGRRARPLTDTAPGDWP